uniref:Transmembrane protein 150B n=1 Tax=Chelydra serpentina TaxID=8475 RepID=A0A8C3SKQ0_CHESE
MWGWALLPVLLAVWGTVGFWTMNLLGPFSSVPSTCGSDPPQSCIFSQVLNTGAFLVVWISYLRFQQVRDWGFPCALNTAGLCLGLLCALGQSNQLETHLFGAFLAFVVGVAYFWVQAALSRRVKPHHGGRWIGPARFCLSAGSTALSSLRPLLGALPEGSSQRWGLAGCWDGGWWTHGSGGGSVQRPPCSPPRGQKWSDTPLCPPHTHTGL